MKSYARVVFVDSKDRSSLPPKVSQALNSAGGSLPLLVFMSPDNETNLGSFNHATLKNQEYSKIFRDLKKQIKATKKEGGFKASGLAAKVDDSAEAGADTDAVMITSPRVRTWKSAKGKEIKAKLIKFQDDTFHLKTTNGKDIKVKASDLDAATVTMAEEIININKK